MRIAVNTLAAIPGVAVSAETYTCSLVRSLLLADKRNEYLLILRKDNTHLFPEEGGRVRHFVSPVGDGSRIARVLWEQVYLPWICRSLRVDLLVVPTGVGPVWVPCRSVIVVTLMLAFRMPEMLPWRKRLYYQWCHALSLRRATRVVALSEQGRQDIQRYVGLDSAKIEVVHPGVSEEFRPESRNANFNPIAEIGEGQDYILAVGPVQPYKNLDLLIRAFARIRARGFQHRLVIASGGQSVPFGLKRLAQEIGVASEVCSIERFLSKEELVTLYSGATVFVHPSSEEQFSLTVLEAMSCGAPVIASDIPSFREQIGDAGVVFGAGDLNALCDAIFAVLSNPVRREEMSRQSLERSRRFSWIAAAEKMLGIFQEVVSEK